MDHNPAHHTVTVTVETEDEDTDAAYTYLESVRITCTAPPDAPCRYYPDHGVCSCEWITRDEDNPGHDDEGHPYIPGQECWVASWFDAEPLALCTTYTGEDATVDTDSCLPLVSRTGHVRILGCDEDGPEWEWADDAPRTAETP